MQDRDRLEAALEGGGNEAGRSRSSSATTTSRRRAASLPEGLLVEYLIDPPHPEENDPITRRPDRLDHRRQRARTRDEYTRKKLPVGKRGYGIMVRIAVHLDRTHLALLLDRVLEHRSGSGQSHDR